MSKCRKKQQQRLQSLFMRLPNVRTHTQIALHACWYVYVCVCVTVFTFGYLRLYLSIHWTACHSLSCVCVCERVLCTLVHVCVFSVLCFIFCCKHFNCTIKRHFGNGSPFSTKCQRCPTLTKHLTRKKQQRKTKTNTTKRKQKNNLKYSRISQYANSCSNCPLSLLLLLHRTTCCGRRSRLGQFQLRVTAFARVSHARLALLLRPLQLLAENVAQLEANAMRLRDETLWVF